MEKYWPLIFPCETSHTSEYIFWIIFVHVFIWAFIVATEALLISGCGFLKNWRPASEAVNNAVKKQEEKHLIRSVFDTNVSE